MYSPCLDGPARAGLHRPWRAVRVFVCSTAALFAAMPLHAGEWTLSPSVRAATTYTDNIALAPDDEESEWVTEIAPALGFTGEGRRAQVDMQYRVQTFFHREESERDRTLHEAAADGTLELLRGHLFVDGNASRTEDLVSADQTVPSSNIFSAARQDVTTYGVGTRFNEAFGTIARLQVRYGRDWLERRELREEIVADTATAALSSGPRFDRWGWRLGYQRVEEDPDAGAGSNAPVQEDRVFERGDVELNLRAGARTQLFAVGGVEENRFEAAEADDAIDGDFWEAGLRWTPRRRTRLEVAVGERFFGETGRVSIDAQGRRLRVRVDYEENLVTSSSLRIERQTQLLRDTEGNIVLTPGGQPISVVVPIATIEDEVILEERATVDIGWKRAFSEISLRVLASEREFLESAALGRSAGADLSYSWTRLPRTVVTVGAGYREQEFADSDREDTVRNVRLDTRRSFGEGLDGSVELAYDELDVRSGGDGYEAGRVTVAVMARF